MLYITFLRNEIRRTKKQRKKNELKNYILKKLENGKQF